MNKGDFGKMRVIISGGGTGGHIYPALTIADTIKRIAPEAEIRVVGTTHGLEKDLVPRAGYPIDFIDVQGFKRSLSTDTFRSIYKLFTGLGMQKNSWTGINRTWLSVPEAMFAAPLYFWRL